MNGNSWLGPAAVLCQRGQSVWLHTNGDIKKVAACKVKPYELVDREENEDKDKKVSKKVMLEDRLEDVENLIDPEKEKLKDAMKLADVTSDNIGTNYLKVINSVSFSDLSIYTVELPVSEHGRPEVKEAKMAEVSNLLDYDVFEEVEDKGQETIGSRWVITAKEKHDGQKQKTKARLVAPGFQETLKSQSDSPNVLMESFKILMAVVANSNFKLASVDIRATFLQLRTLLIEMSSCCLLLISGSKE